ncbi:substrate-binding periplasmic protein [Chromobacterium sp. CV08]|uniref:substrate-binding periplasmic protein n=1 Tax=Chromobacterium sp. CV08 TaxID=3133274 RepID=UPI003DAA0ED6
MSIVRGRPGLALAGGLLCLALADAAPVQTLRLVNLSPLDTPNMLAMRRTLDAVFAEAGLGYTIQYLPPERALAAFMAGEFDGDPNRGPLFRQFFPDAIRVEPHLRTSWYFAVSGSPGVRPRSWADLQRYHIAFLRGLHGIDLMTRHVPRREMPSSQDACIRMALIRRVDLCIVSSPSADHWPGQETYGADAHAVVFEHLNIYLWMGPKQRAVADKLGRTMRAMADRGELQRLMGPYRAD